MKITVVGIGYVGLSLARVLARRHNVTCYDLNSSKLDLLDESPLSDEQYFKDIELTKSYSSKEAYQKADFIFVCVPTDLNESHESLDTKNLEDVLQNVVRYNSKAKVIIKSTLSMECIELLKKYSDNLSIFYSPEFLKENTALHDCLFPSRIVLGYLDEKDIFASNEIGEMIKECTEIQDVKVIVTTLENAIAIKLFSNAYLALRLSFFNEIDSFAQVYNLDTFDIIKGVSLDPRIGDLYNQPSFGFKGYCLPKDTISLANSFSIVPSVIIPSIIQSNQKRVDYAIQRMYEYIKNNHCQKIGIYRLTMEKNSKSIRYSIMEDIIMGLRNHGIEPLVYEPLLKENNEIQAQVISFHELLQCDLIITNRFQKELKPVIKKVFTWDRFNRKDVE